MTDQQGSEQPESQQWGGELWARASLVTPMAIRVVATLQVADHIAAGVRSASELAEVTGADPDALGRVLDHLVTEGVLARDQGGYRLTATGEGLRSDHPDGIRPWLDLDGAVGRADLAFVDLLHTVRTGEAAYAVRYRRPYWEDLAASPALAASFDALMGGRLGDAGALARAYDWGALGRVVDVGGGVGTLLVALLEAHPDLSGTVVDLPAAAAKATAALAEAGLADRGDAVAGNFFDPLPSGAGGYVLSGILHDWDDEHALAILRRCAEALPPDGRVLVIDDLGDPEGGTTSTESDLRMLVYVRGRERNLRQLGELAAAAGLRIGSSTGVGIRAVTELLR